MRKVISLIAVTLALMLALLPGMALGETRQEKNGETGYLAVIDDRAGLLSGSELNEVLEAMREITESTSIGLYTYPADGGDSTAPATKAWKWGEPVFGANTRFAVLVIDMKMRHLDIYASVPLMNALTTADENSISDNIYKLAQKGDYAGCAKEAFIEIARVLRGEQIATPMKYISNALLALVLAMLLAYLVISLRMKSEQAVTMPTVVKGAVAGAATMVTAQKVKRVVRHQSSGGHGGHGGGGGGGFGGGGGSSGGHGF